MPEKTGSDGISRGANRLKSEKSPYLLQHAANPVDWYPWGHEAFEKARREDKPVFLSIGYSSCHWCHVMAHESFEDPRVAALMNDAFVCVKVDREERPDLDNIYMTVCQMMTGSGGWPLSIIMTPDRIPFFAATYIPKENRFGRVGMLDLIPQIKRAWSSGRDEVMAASAKVATALREIARGAAGRDLGRESLDAAYHELRARFDPQNGGFGKAPKFPTPHNLTFLLRYWRRTGEPKALEMVVKTLDMMALGGIYDQIGFGFHRYSTDDRWLVPHFEKMLYDQALLAMAFTEAYQATNRPALRRTAEGILTYVLRDMTSPEGGFYSAEDADSEGQEGKFYVWTLEEVKDAIGDEEAGVIARIFGVERDGNFVDQGTGGRTGANILHQKKPLHEVAADIGVSPEDLAGRVDKARRVLFTYRQGRVHPDKDDKVLADWNGLMIAAMAKAGSALGEARYVIAARRAADFLLAVMRSPDGRLLHRYREGDAAVRGNLSDYAFLVWGLVELYETGFDAAHLKAALDLNQVMLRHFWDDSHGGLFFTPDDGEPLPTRTKDTYDGALPSGNSVAMVNLLRLARITGRSDLEERAVAVARASASRVEASPSAHTHMLAGVDYALGPSCEIVIVGKRQAEDTRAMLDALHARFVPNKVMILRPEDDEPQDIVKIAAFTKDHRSIGGKATAYVCRNQRCDLPTTDVTRMLGLLESGPDGPAHDPVSP